MALVSNNPKKVRLDTLTTPTAVAIGRLALFEGEWAGTAEELLEKLQGRDYEDLDLPKGASRLAANVRAAAEELSAAGVWVQFKKSGSVRTMHLARKDVLRDKSRAEAVQFLLLAGERELAKAAYEKIGWMPVKEALKQRLRAEGLLPYLSGATASK